MKTNDRARIMIVEDDAIVALDLTQALERLGYEVVGHAVEANEAIRLASEKAPALILMDISLKGEPDGIFAATEIGRKQGIPVVFLSGLSDETTLQRATLSSPYGYLLKPFDSEEVHRTIEIALRRAAVDRSNVLNSDADNESALEVSLDADGRDRAEIIATCRLFDAVDANVIDSVAEGASVKQITAGSFISLSQNQDLHCGLVVAGRLALVKGTKGGKELILGLLAPGDWYGLRHLLGAVDFDIAIRAQVSTRVISTSTAALADLARSNQRFTENLARELTSRLDRAYHLASSLAHANVEQRIVHTLLTLIPEFGKSSGPGSAKRIYLTRKELAELTGTTPETAIRTTKHLEREGYLDLSRPGIIRILDPARFTSLVDAS